MVPSQAGSRRVTLTQLAPRKVRAYGVWPVYELRTQQTAGWTPSTFASSRGDRAKKKQARPEDFMDEEDLAELQESRQLVDENEEMDFGGTEAELRQRAGVDTEDECVIRSVTTPRTLKAHSPSRIAP